MCGCVGAGFYPTHPAAPVNLTTVLRRLSSSALYLPAGLCFFIRLFVSVSVCLSGSVSILPDAACLTFFLSGFCVIEFLCSVRSFSRGLRFLLLRHLSCHHSHTAFLNSMWHYRLSIFPVNVLLELLHCLDRSFFSGQKQTSKPGLVWVQHLYYYHHSYSYNYFSC